MGLPRRTGPAAVVAAAALVTLAPSPAAAADPLCPASADAGRIAAAFAARPAPLPMMAAPKLGLTEAAVSAGAPADMTVGVAGSHFDAVWRSLAAWGETLVMIRKGGNVFEIRSTIPSGKPSTRSRYFNLDEATLSGHLRPDLVAAIDAQRIPAADGLARGITFLDAAGDGIFGVFISGEGREPTPAQIAAFDATWALLASLPRRCASP
jgi:putative heme iron utilization protein